MPDRAVRGTVLIAGPDGAGKSTVVEALTGLAEKAGVRVARAHHRPGLLFGGGAGREVTDPHAQPPRSAAMSVAKLAFVLVDHLVGGRVRWTPESATGVLLVERGWSDMAVDPRRYRLSMKALPLVRAAARLLPAPDVVLLLTGDPGELHRRKPEIGVDEIDRQIRAWRRIAPSAGAHVLEADSVVTAPDVIANRVLAALAAPVQVDRRWRRVRMTPSRLEMRASGRSDPALAVYQPQSRRARVGAVLARRRLSRIGPAVVEPVPGLDELWDVLDLCPDGVVCMQSSTPGRQVLSVCREGRMEAVIKIGDTDDAALRHEAAMLVTPISPAAGVRRPAVVWSGEWGSRFILATEAVQRSRNDVWSADEVVPVIEALSKAGTDGTPLTHGDLTPWNLVRTEDGPVLLDWESARWSDEPLHDLAHFVVSEGALLGRYGPAGALSLLCDAGSPGERLLRLRGHSGEESRPLLAEYLVGSTPREPRAIRFASDMLRLVTR